MSRKTLHAETETLFFISRLSRLSPHMGHLSVAERGDNPQIKNNKN